MNGFKHRVDNFPPIVKNLIIINVLVFAAQITLQSQFQVTEKIMLYPLMPEQLYNILVQSGSLSAAEKFAPYQIATHMFSGSKVWSS